MINKSVASLAILLLHLSFTFSLLSQNTTLLFANPVNTPKPLGPDLVSCSLVDDNGTLWFGTTESGLFRFDGEKFQKLSERNGLKSRHIYSLFQDRQKNIWIGTYDGLFKCNADTIVHYPLPHKAMKSEPDAMGNVIRNPDCILSVFEDRDGTLFLGTMGFGIFTIENGKFSATLGNEKLARATIQTITELQDGTICIGTRGEGLWTISHGTIQNHLSNTVNENHILDLHQDHSGKLWVSSVGAGLRVLQPRINPNNDLVLRDSTTLTQKTNSCFLNVTGILQDHAGQLWFCSDGGGICKYDGNQFTNIAANHGLASNRVTTITEDKNGNIWIGGRSGQISRIRDTTIVNFNLNRP